MFKVIILAHLYTQTHLLCNINNGIAITNKIEVTGVFFLFVNVGPTLAKGTRLPNGNITVLEY